MIMDSGKRRLIAIALVAILVVAVVAVVFTSGLLQTSAAGDVTDAAGREVILDGTPERIVSCSPGITEMVFALGLGDNVVAVTDYCDYPAGAAELRDAKSTVGGFWDPSFEKIVDYDPDLVLLNYGTEAHQQLAAKLIDSQVTVLQMFDQKDVASVYVNLGLLGNVTGTSDKAVELVDDLKASIDSTRSAVEDLNATNVLYVSYADSGFTNVYVSGSGTAVDELIGLAGGKNMFDDTEGWPTPSSEALLNRASSIDCMIITSMFSSSAAEELSAHFRNDPTWKESPAVKNNMVFFLQGQGENIFNRQSVRTAEAAQLMAQMLHPEAFDAEVPLYDPTGATVNVIGNDYAKHLALADGVGDASGMHDVMYAGLLATVRD